MDFCMRRAISSSLRRSASLIVSAKAAEERLEVHSLGENQGFYRVRVRYGFMESPNVPDVLELCRGRGLELNMMTTTFFLGRETLIPTKRPGMAIWREKLFAWMLRNAASAMEFFRLPTNRVVELGSQVEI